MFARVRSRGLRTQVSNVRSKHGRAFSNGEQRYSRRFVLTTVVTGSLCGGWVFNTLKDRYRTIDIKREFHVHARDSSSPSRTFSLSEVARHTDSRNGVWTTYEDGVYDLTDFIEQHPGGKRMIMLAAGSRLDPYWNIHDFHKREDIVKILSEFRIGSLMKEEIKASTLLNLDDPYSTDPKRHPALTVFCNKPFLAEPPLGLLGHSLITPTEVFYIRNHMPVPLINKDGYKLEISAKGVSTKLTFEDLIQFKKRIVVATLQCAGNRCNEMAAVNREDFVDVGGGPATISTAQWGGVLLRDVLESVGITDSVVEREGYKHVRLEGLDQDLSGTKYEVSIPIHIAMSPTGDVMLAYEMNGKELPRDHGYPVRCLVPGVAGARSVKWLGRVSLSKQKSQSMWQQTAYKGVPPCANQKTVDLQAAEDINELPVTSVICHPEEGETLLREEEEVTISGYAWSGGGRGIVRVDVSLDGGKTWNTASLDGVKQPYGKAWAWSLWELTAPLPAHGDRMEIICKAVDSSFNVQPDTVAPIYNYRGYLCNAWHRVNVTLGEKPL
ncbi:sulfite oxidase isoform X1 [Nematostella vectensis]|nr:sulfite oxidase isoform X1 [Nematostella vectensis]XP_032229908.1 sulfite oxidase isoform X1 [Nematostella vectensis]XP_032229910.1 sulfite oxidase isoform X1 [Nematostella vectensis]XP_032229911.1 sulfite oxidase isoform X1 [Nematostella vectensis]XP_048579563.1 sulfite oxidase isoform X1 [Nematostella vectensis]XP_048579564.1 sulfite oxidase isoform X1 [Nematostella vectensis]XP_048579565.1 sulfite oxidase isoform X1 [Nematostella vectensis]XP_048579566.1 sulfite oxidase isoform X1 [Nem